MICFGYVGNFSAQIIIKLVKKTKLVKVNCGFHMKVRRTIKRIEIAFLFVFEQLSKLIETSSGKLNVVFGLVFGLGREMHRTKLSRDQVGRDVRSKIVT